VGATLADGPDLEGSQNMKLPEHALRNRAEWTKWAGEYAERARDNWAQDEITWGIWHVAERELGVLDDVADKDVVELGCGTAYFSYWLARRGARVVGVDVTPAQLETARRMQAEFGAEFPLVEANAEDVPLPDESFDLVLSEYGASIWADPYAWIPEAARLLRPGGELVFLVNGVLLLLCLPDEQEEQEAGERLLRPYFGMHRFEWRSDDSVNFQLGYGDWIRLLRAHGLEVEDLIEVQAPPDAAPTRFKLATPAWAQRWPSEEIWKARKRA
jgi:SAM-dependent methyltransferase